MDKLDTLFQTQKELNNFVFEKQKLRAADGAPLTMERLIADENQMSPKRSPATLTAGWSTTSQRFKMRRANWVKSSLGSGGAKMNSRWRTSGWRSLINSTFGSLWRWRQG